MEYQNTKRDVEMFERRNNTLILPGSPKGWPRTKCEPFVGSATQNARRHAEILLE